MPARRPFSRKFSRRAPRLVALRRRLPREHGILHGVRGPQRTPLSKNPLWARSGGQTVGGSLPGGRLTRTVGLIVFLGILAISARYFVGQKLNIAGQIERVARQQYIPQLERQLGTTIEVGSFETDLLGRVIVRDIVVGRDTRLPLGALASARSVTLDLDLIGLVLRRTQPLDAVKTVTIDTPRVSLERDARGQLNVMRLVRTRPGAPPFQWYGAIVVRNGQLYYRDQILRSSRGIPLEVEARGVNGSVNFAGKAPLRYTTTVEQALLPRENISARSLEGNGAYELATKQGIVSVEAPPIPASVAAQYVFRKRELIVTQGNIKGHIVIGIDGKRIDPRGEVVLDNVGGTIPSVREPLNGRPKAGPIVRLESVNGPLRFVGTAFESRDLAVRAFDADWKVNGLASLGAQKLGAKTPLAPVFDVNLTTANAPLTRLRPWVQRTLPAEVSSRVVRVNAHIAGNTTNVRASGTAEAGPTRLVSALPKVRGDVQAPEVRGVWAVAYQTGTPVRFAARVQLPIAQIEGQVPINGTYQNTQGRTRGVQLTVRGASLNAPLQVTARAASWEIGTPQYGYSTGRDLRVDAFKPADTTRWQGAFSLAGASTGNVRRAAISPEFARFVRESGTVSARGNFTDFGSPRPNVQADVALTSISFAREAIPETLRQRLGQELDRTLQLTTLQGQVALQNGEFALTNAQASSPFGILRGEATRTRFGLQVPDFRLTSNQLNGFLRSQRIATNGDWRGRLQLNAQPGSRNFDAQFALYCPRAALGTAGTSGTLANAQAILNGPRIEGTARLADNNLWRANARLTVSEGLVRSGQFGTTSLRLPPAINGTRLRDAALTFAATPTGWSARVNGNRLAVPLQGRVLTLESVSLVAQNGADTPNNTFAAQFSDIQVTRISAQWGDSGQFDGTAHLRRGEIQARLLAREVEADAVQRLLATTSRNTARLSGRFNALLQIEPKQNPRFEVQMARGSTFLPTQNLRLPLSDVLVRGDVQPEGANVLRITDFSGWSEGARLTASGSVGLRTASGKFPSGSGSLELTGLRLSRLPLPTETRQNSALDGVVNGNFKWELGETPQLEGTASLRGTTFSGVAVDKADGEVFLARDPEGVRVRLERWKGTIEDAAFKGDLEADTNQNFWRLRFNTPEIASRRLARLQARTFKKPGTGSLNPLQAALPVEGNIFADIDINGTLRPLSNEENQPAAQQRPFWVPREGFATIKAPSLTWRGRPLGTLNADLSFERDFARIRTLELKPDEDTENDTPSSAPSIILTGDVPLLPNKPGLDATLKIGEAPLQWFFENIRDGREILRRNGVKQPALDQVISSLDALPNGVRGRVALEASFAGAWSSPTIAVPSLTLRDGRVPLPQGGFSPPATLNTSFAVAGGALTLGSTELLLQKTAAERENQEDDDPAQLTIASGGRVDPQGDVDLQIDINNANLSQLANWLPALKNSTGAPTLRGTLSGFSISVKGKTSDPTVIGSIQGENLSYNKYTIDRLLISRFEIGNGRAEIAPGNLTIAKGSFQSSAAWGRVGWDWTKKGVSPDAPLELHFPLQTRDFGALSSVLVSDLSDVKAENFQGSLDVGGTLNNPAINGQLKVQGGQFRYASVRSPFPIGITDLNGTIRFEENNHLVIDADDPLRGRLVGAAKVAAQKKADAKRSKGTLTQKEAQTQATAEAAKNLGNTSAQLAGQWKLQGDVLFSDLSPTGLTNPARAVGRQKYNLAFSLDDGSYSASDFAGIRDVSFAARWQTGEDNSQRVRWMLAARGTRDAKNKKNIGQAFGIGSVRLAPNFATGLDALLNSQPEEFTSTDDFKTFPVASRFSLTSLPDRRTQVLLQNFGWNVTGAGNGELDGRVVLDTRATVQQVPKVAALFQKVTLNSKDKAPSLRDQLNLDRSRPVSFFGNWNDDKPVNDTLSAQRTGFDDDEPTDENDQTSANNLGSLRLGGMLTLQNTEIYGAPTGGAGNVTRLSFFPPAPRFDIKLKLGRNVEFISSALRTQLQGELIASGTPNNPVVSGTVETREGQVRFPNARARIEEGRLIVLVSRNAATDLLNTRVDIDVTARGDAGVSQVISTTSGSSSRPTYQRYQITLRLRGPIILGNESNQDLQNLSIDVTSNPPLSQGDALAQLLGVSVPRDSTTGNYSSGEANEAYARAVLQLVSAPLFSGVERSVAQALGLDNVGFEYRFNEPLAVQFSKAVGDRIYITYRRSLGSDSSYNGARTPFELRIDYRLKGNLLLGLRIDEQNIRTLSLLKSWRF